MGIRVKYALTAIEASRQAPAARYLARQAAGDAQRHAPHRQKSEVHFRPGVCQCAEITRIALGLGMTSAQCLNSRCFTGSSADTGAPCEIKMVDILDMFLSESVSA